MYTIYTHFTICKTINRLQIENLFFPYYKNEDKCQRFTYQSRLNYHMQAMYVNIYVWMYIQCTCTYVMFSKITGVCRDLYFTW